MGGKSDSGSGAHDYYGTIAGLVCAGPVDELVSVVNDGKTIWPAATKGDWIVGAPYFAGDMVRSAGRVWESLWNHTSTAPNGPPNPDYWIEHVVKRSAVGVGNPLILPVFGYGTLILYWGTDTQTLDSVSEPTFYSEHPAYRNQCFAILKDWLFGRERTSAPSIEIVVRKNPVQSILTGSAAVLDADHQANPLAFMAEALTHPVFGIQQAPDLLDAASWGAVADALSVDAPRTHLSPVLTKGEDVASLAAALTAYFDGYLRWNRSGKIEAGRFPHNEAPGLFGADKTIGVHDLVEEVSFDSDGWSDTVSEVNVRFNDRDRAFKESAAKVQSLFNRTVTGEPKIVNLDRPWITRATQAAEHGAEYVRMFAEPGMKGTITVRIQKCEAILPGDQFMLEHGNLGVAMVCRCIEKTIEGPGNDRASIRFVSERATAPTLYQPALSDPVDGSLPAPEVITLYRFVSFNDGSDIRLVVLAARKEPTTTSFRVHLRQADGSLFYELGRQASWPVTGALQQAYPNTNPVDDASEDLRVTLDALTVPSDLERIQATQTADAINDDSLVMWIFNASGSFEILTVKEMRIATGETFYRFKVRRARFGTARLSFSTSDKVFVGYRSDLVYFSHSSFRGFSNSATVGTFRLQPRNIWTEADLSDTAACPDRTHTFGSQFASLTQSGTVSGYYATSATSLTIGTGSKTLTTQAGLAYVPGTRVRVANSASAWMEGTITSYSGTSMAVAVDQVAGSGTFTSWSLGVAGSVSEIVCDTWAKMADLDVSTLANGAIIRVRGRAAAQDGGEGVYTYDSTSSISAIPGLVIIPTVGSGRFLRNYGTSIDPARDMGADNKLTADAQPIIQAAIDFAADPTYGWAMPAGEASQVCITVELSPGTYLLNSTLVMKGGVELKGAKYGSDSGDYGNNAVLHTKHGGVGIKWDWAADASGGYRQATIRQLFMTGYSETYQTGKITIKSVTSRTQFAVASTDGPAAIEDRQIYASNNTCFFFSPLGQYLGSARVLSATVVGSDCNIVLESGSDYYTSINATAGGLLTTACTVVWASRVTNTETALGVGNFNAPSRSGSIGIQLVNSDSAHNGGLCRIEDVYLIKYHVGIEFGPRLIGGRYSNVTVKYCRFAGIAHPRHIHTTDHVVDGMILINGTYSKDYGANYSGETIDNPEFQFGAYGIWNLSAMGKYDKIQCEHTAYADLFVSRTIFTRIDQLLCDNACGNGLVISPGYYLYSPPTTSASSNWLSIGSAAFRGQFDSKPCDTLHDRVAIKFERPDPSDTGKFGAASITELQIIELGSTRLFTYGFDLGASAYNNRLMVLMMPEKNGYSAMYAPSSKLVEWGTHLGMDSAADVQTGWYGDATKRVFAVAGNDVFKIDSNGITVGSASHSLIPLNAIVGNATTVAKFTRSAGSPQVYEAKLSTGVFKLVDTDLGKDSLTIFSNSSVNQIWIGSNLGNASAARSCNIYSENRTGGTDLAPNNLNFVAPGGTGASAANGAIGFYTADPTVSGTGSQNVTLKLQLQRSGQLRFIGITPVSLAEGDAWFDTSKGFRQYFAAAERPLAPKRIGSAVLVAGTVTVFTSSVKSTSLIFFTVKTVGGTPGTLSSTVVDSTSFTINSSSGTDTSTVNWLIWEP